MLPPGFPSPTRMDPGAEDHHPCIPGDELCGNRRWDWNPRWDEDTNEGKRIKDEWDKGPHFPVFQLVPITPTKLKDC